LGGRRVSEEIVREMRAFYNRIQFYNYETYEYFEFKLHSHPIRTLIVEKILQNLKIIGIGGYAWLKVRMDKKDLEILKLIDTVKLRDKEIREACYAYVDDKITKDELITILKRHAIVKTMGRRES
jgi:hypothetical protein